MAVPALPEHQASAVPVCQVNCIHADIVAALKPEVDHIQGVAAVFKALADDTRVKIVFALSRDELCVCDVAAIIDGSTATASYHLRLLYHLGLAAYRRCGKLVYYRLADPHVGELVWAVRDHQVARAGARPAAFVPFGESAS